MTPSYCGQSRSLQLRTERPSLGKLTHRSGNSTGNGAGSPVTALEGETNETQLSNSRGQLRCFGEALSSQGATSRPGRGNAFFSTFATPVIPNWCEPVRTESV